MYTRLLNKIESIDICIELSWRYVFGSVRSEMIRINEVLDVIIKPWMLYHKKQHVKGSS